MNPLIHAKSKTPHPSKDGRGYLTDAAKFNVNNSRNIYEAN